MKLTKRQRAQRQIQLKRAAAAALRAHFMGDGATSRRLRFLLGASLASAVWVGKLLCLASWAVIAGLLAGPRHDFFLTELHAWMLATPVNQVLLESRAAFVWVITECVMIGVLVGFGRELLALVTPAVQQVKQDFASLAD